MLSPDETPLGIPAADTVPALQQDAFLELVNKLAWVLGSTYRAQYSNKGTVARRCAIQLATTIRVAHGYPSKIAKP